VAEPTASQIGYFRETLCHNRLIFESLFEKEVIAAFPFGRKTSKAVGSLLRERDRCCRLHKKTAGVLGALAHA
jgi:hypothetical protein